MSKYISNKLWECPYCKKVFKNTASAERNHLRTHVATGKLLEYSTTIQGKNRHDKKLVIFEPIDRLHFSLNYVGGLTKILRHIPDAEAAARYIWKHLEYHEVPFFQRTPIYVLFRYLKTQYEK